jgi:carbamoyltransferase
VKYCLDHAGLALEALDYVVFCNNPLLKFDRLLETYLAFAPSGYHSLGQLFHWAREKLFQRQTLEEELEPFGNGTSLGRKLLFAECHLGHAESGFYPSTFEAAAVLTLDGIGEWATTSAGIGRSEYIEIFKEIHFPHSLGLLYSAMTY